MGLLSFLKNAGANLFGKGKSESDEIKKLIESSLPGKITNLNVGYADGLVTLSGSADSLATKEKAVLLAGNVKGVAKVDDSKLSSPAGEATEFYTVVSGDSLSKIAKKYYGDAKKYPVIFEANREVIKDPDLIYPGQKLRIPKQ